MSASQTTINKNDTKIEGSVSTAAFAAQSSDKALEPFKIERREPQANDVMIDILFCGVCHSDIHQTRDEWGGAIFPMVPGHEIVGRISKVGSQVTKFKANELVGVGCFVDSCRVCDACREGLENYCERGATFTYSAEDPKYGGVTYGGYSQRITVDENYVVKIPENLDTAATAPLLCAGITTYSPLKHWKVGKGDKVGIVGLGGLGHMGVKFAHALGAHVVMITTSPGKGADAKRLGADEVLISKNADEMKKHVNSFDFILNTIPTRHDVNPYLELLKRDKTMVIVGALEALPDLMGSNLIMKRKSLAGSLIGGIAETQEMLDFCGKHNITSDVEIIPIQKINEAFDRTVKSDVKYRFVIDMASLK